MRLALLAAPGAGKGTQAVRIADRYGVAHLSSGDLFRAEVAAGSPLGRRVAGHLDAGDLVPDEVVDDVVAAAVGRALAETGGFILDGYPRTLAQARRVVQPDSPVAVQLVVHLAASELVLVHRLASRDQSRPDDDPLVARHRLDVYAAATTPLLSFFDERGLLRTVDADGAVDEVSAALFDVCDPLADR